MKLHLVSHRLCPYVQRAAISLAEKGAEFERTYIDLSNKPDWFLAVSPLGRTPVLLVGECAIFESAVILEYLEETQARPLHPGAPLRRARHRAWMEFGSAVLNDIAGLYSASDAAAFGKRAAALRDKFVRIERECTSGPYFDGDRFCLVDAVFGPVFRYFDVFDEFADFDILAGLSGVNRWRRALAARPSVQAAVSPDYPRLLRDFVKRRGGYMSALVPA